jgi:hypothetical protein
MKQLASRVAGLLLFVTLLVGPPFLSALDHDYYKDHDKDKVCDGDARDSKKCDPSVAMPDSHGAPLLALTAGVLGAAIFVQRRRKVTS